MEDLITIIIPIYNVEKYLRECLDSIINQTYKKLQIILVDDGSKDSSGKICDEYQKKDNRIEVIHTTNQGVSAARNTALEMTKGEYITFVDGDDYLEKDYCEKMLTNLKKQKVECIRCGYNRVYENSKEIIKAKNAELVSNENFLNSVLQVQGGAGIPSSKLWKKESIINLRFNEKLKIAEDSLFIMQSIKNIKNVYILNEALYNYRFNQDSAVRKYKKDFADICLDSMKVAKEYIEKEYGNNEKIIKKFNNYIAYHVLLISVNFCFNKDNNLSWLGQIKCLKDVLKIPEYKEGVKKANYEGLSLTRKIALFTIKHKLYFITMLIGKIRQAQFKKIKGKKQKN